MGLLVVVGGSREREREGECLYFLKKLCLYYFYFKIIINTGTKSF